MPADRKVATQVRALVVELRERGVLTLAGEAKAALAVRLACDIDAGANAAMARELQTVLDDLEGRALFEASSPEPGEPAGDAEADGRDDDETWDELVDRLSSPVGNAEES